MPENIVISVGGTGAKIVESLLPCLAAGLGPSSLSVCFVDQDESNGNVTRARQHLTAYRALRKAWSEGEHRLTWSGAGATGFAATDALSLVGGSDLWCPHPNRTTTLSEILNRKLLDENNGHLMDLLFHADEREQEMQLGEGYRGQPHIGAAAMVSEVLKGATFWAALEAKIRSARAGDEVRLFLVGSVFGGTGAAGFPTIARVIRNFGRDEQVGRTIKLGGLLMLPYFSFSPPKAGENAAKPEDLLIQSQGAIKYYARLLQNEQIFNQIYMLGWNPRFQLGYGSPGSSTQLNPPLPPELIGALACLKFFQDPVPDQIANATYVVSREKEERLEWADMPAIDENAAESRQKILLCIGQLLRFCIVWRNTIRPQLRKRINPLGWPAWARRQGANSVTYNADQDDALKKLDQVVSDILVWAASLGGFATQGGLASFELWDATRLGSFDKTAPTDPVHLYPPMSDDRTAEAYSNAVRGLDEAQKARSQGALIDEISDTRLAGDYQGLGRLVAAVFKGARLFDEQPSKTKVQ